MKSHIQRLFNVQFAQDCVLLVNTNRIPFLIVNDLICGTLNNDRTFLFRQVPRYSLFQTMFSQDRSLISSFKLRFNIQLTESGCEQGNDSQLQQQTKCINQLLPQVIGLRSQVVFCIRSMSNYTLTKVHYKLAFI